MTKRLELEGQKFGRLTVGNYSKPDKSWICNCECGKTVFVQTNNLTAGKSKSCGCLRAEITSQRMKNQSPACKKESGEGSMSCLMNRYKQDAKRRNLDWSLSRDVFKYLTKLPCHYCGQEPVNFIKGHRSNGEYIYNGIDRVSSSVGYHIGNCVTCCEKCNYAKRELTYDEFKKWISRVFNHCIKGEV